MPRTTVISWLATNHDPYREDGAPGPTLTLLFDPESPHKGAVDRLVVLYNGPHLPKAERLKGEVERRGVTTELEHVDEVPIDHAALFPAVRAVLERVRDERPDDELVVHVSPGTPAMHTVWVLLAETGLLDGPYRLVQTVPRRHWGGLGPVRDVHIGLDTPLKAYKAGLDAPAAEPEAGLDSESAASEALRALYAEARVLAQLRVPVLILGERGAGKSTLASWVRANSPFRRKANDAAPPQVACGQFSPELMRSELFGHRRGAFTGATADRDGLLKRADGDTLFLDEVGDLTRDTQRLLIRAVESGEYTPHGSDAVERSEFRLVTATNLPPDELRDRLDADFFDRISHFVLEAPPLREIREDVPRLWDRSLSRAARDAAASQGALEAVRARRAEILPVLSGHPLPGNFRDLHRAAYHALATASAGGDGVVDAVRRALSGPARGGSHSPLSSVLVACGEGRPVDWDRLEGGVLPTRDVLNAARAHMAREIRRRARAEGVPEEEVGDIRPRTVQDWMAK